MANSSKRSAIVTNNYRDIFDVYDQDMKKKELLCLHLFTTYLFFQPANTSKNMFDHIWKKYKLGEIAALGHSTTLTDDDRLFIGDLICAGEEVYISCK